MNYPSTYIDYLIEFHTTRDYFECHELLEEYWKEHPQDGLGKLWVMCIQVAVGQYHERRENRRGANRMYQSALAALQQETSERIGLDPTQLAVMLKQRIEACEKQAAYEDMLLPFLDKELLELCKKEAAARGLSWGQESASVPDFIIHRHTLRDRSDVIAARQAALKAKARDRK
ncbi:DUF309 domain-containing protein [Paenibacillus camelliae]|uniref:DUF309 domain-containing protein n=1 Tax=Paenibacillus camelliae TaxID=512410 RepID=UPI00203C6815|nr:DUF309 domain-containing protein [Paenibacillus camelliae]MCM3632957.1 DUF309 domain-containing protein [Paenibacillus camelliae]